MTAIAIALFTLASGLFALGVIAASWRRHGAEALALRGRLANAPEMRSFTYRIVSQGPQPRPSARVLPFPARRSLSPAGSQPLRAAA